MAMLGMTECSQHCPCRPPGSTRIGPSFQLVLFGPPRGIGLNPPIRMPVLAGASSARTRARPGSHRPLPEVEALAQPAS